MELFDRLAGGVDNSGAAACLAKGSSRDVDTSRFVHVFNTVAAALQLVVWWEHVPSAANVADLPSRDGTFRDAPLRATLDAAEILEVAWPDPASWVLPSADLAPLYERLAGRSRKRARGSR